MGLKFNRTDKFILFFSVAIVLVFSYFLYDDSFLFQSRKSKNTKVGSIKIAENDVRLRASDSFTWNNAKTFETVYERDSIFTGRRSQTQIELTDGSKISLNENSLITLVSKNGMLELNLRYGNIKAEIKSDSNLELKAGSQKILLKKESSLSSIEIKKPKFGSTKLKLLSGKISLKQTPTAKPEALNVNSSMDIRPNGVPQKSNPGSIALITPNNIELLFKPEEKGIFLDWNSLNTDKNKIEISSDNTFKTVVFSESNIKSKVLVKDLPIGSYYWKISGIDLNNLPIQSEVRFFKIVKPEVLEKLTIVEPSDKKRIVTAIIGNIALHKEPVKISWNDLYEAVNVQVSKSKSFDILTLDKEVKSSSSIVPEFTNGLYYVRVRGKKNEKNAYKYSEWSDINSFEVNVITKVLTKPGTPILASKKLIFSSKPLRSPTSLSPVNVAWLVADNAVRYELEFSNDDKTFSKPLRIKTSETKVSFMPKSAGTQHFRVRAFSQNNLASDYSDIGEIKTDLSAPKLSQIEKIQRKSDDPESLPPDVQFEIAWTPIPLASNYIIEASENESFLNAEKKSTDTNKFQFRTSRTGKHYFRVLASDSSQTIKSLPSDSEQTEYTFIKRLAKPILVQPKNKMTVFLQKEIEPFIWLNWESSVDQKNFEIEISTDKSFKTVLLRKSILENKFLIKDKLPLGKIFWRVRQLSKSPDLISDWTDVREFQLIHNKNEGVFR